VDPVLIGYFPKESFSDQDYLSKLRAGEIDSISDCISSGPEGWIEHWTHNDMHCYDTEDLAWSVVPLASRADFRVFAYRLFPRLFVAGTERDLVLPPLTVTPPPPSYIFLGYDVVGLSTLGTDEKPLYQFACSPLSCNCVAQEVPVNDFCLLDSLADAFARAQEWSASGGVKAEPGDYVVGEVWSPKVGALKA
jgi:hypothetical protein